MISKKTKIFSSIAIIALIAAPIFFKKEKKGIEIIKSNTSLGIHSSLINTKSNGIVHIRCKFKNAGVLQNNLSNHGISIVVSYMLFNRINGLNHEETMEQFLKLGISGLSVDADSDNFEFSFFVKKEGIKEALEFLSLAFKKPTFSPEDLEYIKNMLPHIPNQETSLPEELIIDKLFGMLFIDHPYGMNRTGTAQVISGMSVDKVLKFIKDELRSDNLHVIITGDVSRYESNTIIDTLFNGLSKSENNDAQKSNEILSEKLSEEKSATIIKPELEDIACIATGIRLDKLSKEERAAAYVIISLLFHSKYGDFIEQLKSSGIRFSKCVAKIERLKLANIFTVITYVKKEDIQKYNEFIDRKFKQYFEQINLKALDKEKEYFAISANNGFTNISDCYEEMKNKLLPYEDISKETFLKVTKMLFNIDKTRTVICFGGE